jgi:predicted nucleotide-binding protein (sugar kinase/HSP70/actin superfamily)
MTLNPKSLRKGPTKRKLKTMGSGRNRMTAEEEKAVAKAYREIKESKARTFKNADEYLKYLDTV